jgi:hypothetical protein
MQSVSSFLRIAIFGLGPFTWRRVRGTRLSEQIRKAATLPQKVVARLAVMSPARRGQDLAGDGDDTAGRGVTGVGEE